MENDRKYSEIALDDEPCYLHFLAFLGRVLEFSRETKDVRERKTENFR